MRTSEKLDFSDVADDAGMLVTLLESVAGDVDAFAQLFGMGDNNPMMVVQRSLLTLNKADNITQRFKWDQLINAYKEAKVLLAQRTAVDFLASFRLPDPDKASVQDVMALARFWMSDHSTAQTTRARKVANEAAPRGELTELAEIEDEMSGDD